MLECLVENLINSKKKQKDAISKLNLELIYNKGISSKLMKVYKSDKKILATLEKIKTIYKNGYTLKDTFGETYEDKKILNGLIEDDDDEEDYFEYIGLFRKDNLYSMISYIKQNISMSEFSQLVKESPKKCCEQLALYKYYKLYTELSYYLDNDDISTEMYINIKSLYTFIRLRHKDMKINIEQLLY